MLISSTEDEVKLLKFPQLNNNDNQNIEEFTFLIYDDNIFALAFFAERSIDEFEFLTGGTSGKVRLFNSKLWNTKDWSPQTVAKLPETIQGFCLSPDGHILIVFLENSKMQIWNTQPFSFIKQLDMRANNFSSFPVFLSNYKNRIMLYFDQMIDCYNGEIIFRFEPQREMISFFFNSDYNYYYYNEIKITVIIEGAPCSR